MDWSAAKPVSASPSILPATTQERAPLAYTPKHLIEKILTTRSALEGERKQVTVLCADIADSSGLATPDTMVISAATIRLVEGTCALEDLESHRLKGVEEPLRVYRVLGLLEDSRHTGESVTDRAVFLVGWDEEVGLLRRRWEQSKEGVGQAVLVRGEAGIGKSTLVQTLRTQVVEEGYP